MLDVGELPHSKGDLDGLHSKMRAAKRKGCEETTLTHVPSRNSRSSSSQSRSDHSRKHVGKKERREGEMSL